MSKVEQTIKVAGKSLQVHTGLFINNEFVPSDSGKKFETINPSTGKVITEVYAGQKEDVDKAVKAAKKAFKDWRKVAPADRGLLLYRLADLIEKNIAELSMLESLDNGKPLKNSREGDLPQVVQCFRYYAGWADKIHGKTIDVGPAYNVMTRHEPIGVVGQIIPWNFPLLMLAWKWGPALACGNTIVMKVSQKTPLSALKLCELVKQAGFPPGVINVIPGSGEVAGQAIVEHKGIKKIAFTGSTSVGKQVMECATQSNLKKVTLELGGKSPNIVFKDADLESAVHWANDAIYFNQGQNCVAGSRLFVHEDIYDDFVKRFIECAKKTKVGDPFDSGVTHGPIVDETQFKRVMDYIETGKQEGAKIVLGGQREGKEGYFIPPTLFTGVSDDMKIAQQEIFGPVLCAFKFKTTEEVVRRANKTSFGLAAAIHTRNLQTALKVQAGLDVGTVWINCYNSLFSSCPFGGMKESGVGRELGEYALHEYTQVKSVITMLESE